MVTGSIGFYKSSDRVPDRGPVLSKKPRGALSGC